MIGAPQVDANRPDVFRLQRRLLADQLALVPGFPMLAGFHGGLLGVDGSLIVDRRAIAGFGEGCQPCGIGQQPSFDMMSESGHTYSPCGRSAQAGFPSARKSPARIDLNAEVADGASSLECPRPIC